MKDVQCKKKGNQVIPVSEAAKDHFGLDVVCYSCLDFDPCKRENEQNEIEGLTSDTIKSWAEGTKDNTGILLNGEIEPMVMKSHESNSWTTKNEIEGA